MRFFLIFLLFPVLSFAQFLPIQQQFLKSENKLVNPGCESGKKGWPVNGTSLNFISSPYGQKACSANFDSNSDYVKQLVDLSAISGSAITFSTWVKTTGSGIQLAYDDGVSTSGAISISSDGLWHNYVLYFTANSTTSQGIRFYQNGSTSQSITFDNSFLWAPSENYIAQLTGDITAIGPNSSVATLASIVSPGSCTNCDITFDSKGRATAYTSGSSGSGVTGPAISSNGAIALFNGTSGAAIKQLDMGVDEQYLVMSGSAISWKTVSPAGGGDCSASVDVNGIVTNEICDGSVNTSFITGNCSLVANKYTCTMGVYSSTPNCGATIVYRGSGNVGFEYDSKATSATSFDTTASDHAGSGIDSPFTIHCHGVF